MKPIETKTKLAQTCDESGTAGGTPLEMAALMVLLKALTYVLAAGMPCAQPMPHDTTPARYVVPPDAQATGPPLSP